MKNKIRGGPQSEVKKIGILPLKDCLVVPSQY